MSSYFDTAEALTRDFVKKFGTAQHLAVWVSIKPSALFQDKVVFRQQVKQDIIIPFAASVSLSLSIPQHHLDKLFSRSFYDMVRYLDAVAKEEAVRQVRRNILRKPIPGLP